MMSCEIYIEGPPVLFLGLPYRFSLLLELRLSHHARENAQTTGKDGYILVFMPSDFAVSRIRDGILEPIRKAAVLSVHNCDIPDVPEWATKPMSLPCRLRLTPGVRTRLSLLLPEDICRSLEGEKEYVLQLLSNQTLHQGGFVVGGQSSSLAPIIGMSYPRTLDVKTESRKPMLSFRTEKIHGIPAEPVIHHTWTKEEIAKYASNPTNQAPRLAVQIHGRRSIIRDEHFSVVVGVEYLAESNEPPITIRTSSFESTSFIDGYFQLERFTDGVWEACNEHWEDYCELGINYDDPDVNVKVGDHSTFASLYPGEIWAAIHEIQGKEGFTEVLPCDRAPGQRFRYSFVGDTLDWWSWGTKHDHAETIILLPPSIMGRVVAPSNNDGRPQLMVPPSEPLEFVII